MGWGKQGAAAPHRAAQVGAGEVGAGEVGAGEIRLAERCAGEVGARDWEKGGSEAQDAETRWEGNVYGPRWRG